MLWTLLFPLLTQALPAQVRAHSEAAMEARIQLAVRKAPGTVSLFAKNLDSGKSYGIRAGEKVRTASTIKLPIMVAVFAEVAAGRAEWTEELKIGKDDKVSGSGVLSEFSDNVKIPLIDAVRLMIVVSDNTATNLVLDRVPADVVNRHMEELGFPVTRAMRKILGDRNQLKPNPSGFSAAGKLAENQKYGIGVSTPQEMVMLLEKIERGEVVSPEACREMIAILKRQRYKEGIGRRLDALPVASKSGALDALRSDVGIVYTKGGRIAMAITVDGMKKTDWSPDNAGHLVISEIAGVLIEGLGTGAR